MTLRAPRLPSLPGLLCLLSTLLAAPPALAHKVNVFATAVGAVIEGQVYFAGGAPAVGIAVRVQTASGEPLGRTTTDAQGLFRFQAERRVDHVLIADTGDGHVGRHTIRAATLPARLAAAGTQDETRDSAEPEPPVHPPVKPAAGATADAALEALVEDAVARQLAPLRRDLAELRDGTRLTDVLGGLGWIVGLAGVVLWMKARRP